MLTEPPELSVYSLSARGSAQMLRLFFSYGPLSWLFYYLLYKLMHSEDNTVIENGEPVKTLYADNGPLLV